MNDTNMPCRRMVITVLGAVAMALGGGGCGASIQAVYEGNVRFEHCMALDAQAEVTPVIRRACWVEWVQFYTYGQTRDRVVHAQIRIQQLNNGSAFVDPPLSGGSDSGASLATVPPGLGDQGASSLGQAGSHGQNGTPEAGD